MVLFCVSCFFIAEEVDGVGHNGSEDAKRLPLKCACFMDEVWFWQTQNFWSWDYSPQCQLIRISELLDNGLKEFCCIFLYRGLFC